MNKSKVTFTTALFLIVGLVVGNFFYQLMQESPNWISAVERSFFNMNGVLAAWLIWRDWK